MVKAAECLVQILFRRRMSKRFLDVGEDGDEDEKPFTPSGKDSFSRLAERCFISCTFFSKEDSYLFLSSFILIAA